MADFTPERISAGEVVVNNQGARAEGATVQNPANPGSVDTSLLSIPLSTPQAQDLLSINNRLRSAGVILQDSGLNAKTINLIQSQATPPSNVNAFTSLTLGQTAAQYEQEIRSNISGFAPTGKLAPGIGARGDDGVPVTGNSTKDIINRVFQASTNQRIYTQPNVLDDYASYTYQLSWYLLDPDQYNEIQKSPKINPATWQLLMQSGGAPGSPNPDPSSSIALPGRSPLFPVDFYLDDLEMLTKAPGRGTNMPVTTSEIKFKVIEPNGITLINRIYKAVASLYGPGSNSPELDPGAYTDIVKNVKGVNSTPPNYTTAVYVMGIKFYGYDNAGNLIAPLLGKYSPKLTKGQAGPTDDTYAIVQKYIAFKTTEIKFRTGLGQYSKGLEYYIKGSPVALNYAFGQNRGTIPFTFELSGTTVKDLLIGKAAQSELKESFIQDGRVPQAGPPGKNKPLAPALVVPPTLSSIATGVDNPLATTGGMDFTAGNF